jgi:hypothetical protein
VECPLSVVPERLLSINLKVFCKSALEMRPLEVCKAAIRGISGFPEPSILVGRLESLGISRKISVEFLASANEEE